MNCNDTLIKENLELLSKRLITPSQCKENLGIVSNEELTKLCIANKRLIHKRKKKFTLKDIKEMNYLEIIDYIDKEEGGIEIEDLIKEIYIMWCDYKIRGFDYRYFIESLGININKEFVCFSRSIDRFED